MSEKFCAYCFGPILEHLVVKNGRSYHAGHENQDKPITTSVLTTAEGVKVGGRGGDVIAKYPGAFGRTKS